MFDQIPLSILITISYGNKHRIPVIEYRYDNMSQHLECKFFIYEIPPLLFVIHYNPNMIYNMYIDHQISMRHIDLLFLYSKTLFHTL